MGSEREGLTLNIVGNIGPETIEIEDRESQRVLGGSLTHVAVVAGSLGQQAIIFGGLGDGNGEWQELETSLEISGVDTKNIWDRLPAGIEFILRYSKELDLLSMDVKQNTLQGIAVAAFVNYLDNLSAIDSETVQESITYVCPLPPEMQEEVVTASRGHGSLVALSTHSNLLENPDNLKKFREMLPETHFLSINYEEARRIVGLPSTNVGESISGMTNGGLVFITRGADGVEAFQNGEKVGEVRPCVDREIVDVTGAGDVFFGTAVVRLVQLGWDGEDGATVQRAMNDAQKMADYKLTNAFGFSKLVDGKRIIGDEEEIADLSASYV